MTKQIGLYLESIGTPKERLDNEDLFLQLEETDEDEKPTILEKIILGNLGLIHYIIRKRYSNAEEICRRIRVTYDDLFSAGYYGLIKACHTFDVTKGYKFATYATMVIHNEYGMFMRKHKRSFMDTSLQNVVNQDDTGNEMTLMDILVDDNDLIEEVMLEEFGLQVMLELERVIKPKHLAILRMYIMDDDMNQREIANRLGLSQSYVSRIINKTMERARRIYHKLEVV